MPRSLVIDTDTGSDDAVALLMAARIPAAEVRAVTTVAGNVPLDQATRNALVTLEVAGVPDVPVYAGLAKPLWRDLSTARQVHGQDGMSDTSLPAPTRTPGLVTFVGWDRARRYAVIKPEDQETLRGLGPLGRFAVDINRCLDALARTQSGLPGFDLPDPITMAVAIDDRVALEREHVHVDIGTDDTGRGGTFVDRRLGAEPNAVVVSRADEVRFKQMLTEACTEGGSDEPG